MDVSGCLIYALCFAVPGRMPVDQPLRLDVDECTLSLSLSLSDGIYGISSADMKACIYRMQIYAAYCSLFFLI